MRLGLLTAWAGTVLCSAGTVFGIITSDAGPDSVRGRQTFEQPGWPAGMVELPRHESRVYAIWENGTGLYYFQADGGEMQELIDLFSKTRLRDHEIWIKPRSSRDSSFFSRKVEFNVTLRVPNGSAWAGRQDKDPQDTYEPTLTIYLDLPKDQALGEKLKLPDNIILHNELADNPLKGKATRPKRESWHCLVRFTDSTPVTYPLVVHATLWERSVKEGIKLGKVELGLFEFVFSEQELADIKSGKSWITLTAGNWMSESKSDDPRLPAEKLTREVGNNEVVTIPTPPLYYGRLLFEDGSPVIGGPYFRANNFLTFPFTGRADVDFEGYFMVCFTGDQFEQTKARKPDRNIYVPDPKDSSRSRGLYVFPASKLSRDKATAGEVRIPRPSASVPAE